MNWLKENWFKIFILILLLGLLITLRGGIDVRVSGWVESERPSGPLDFGF